MRSGSNVFKRLAAVAASCLLVTACATGPIPHNGDEFIAYYANNPWVKKDKVRINKPYAAVMASITPMVKKCYNESWFAVAPSVRVANGVRNTGKIVTRSNSHAQVTIQQRDVTVHYPSDTPPDGAYIFVTNVKAVDSGSTSLEIYSSLSRYRDRLVEAASGKTPHC